MTKGAVTTRVLVIAPGTSRSVDVPYGASAVVGRAKDCEVLVELPSISRHHLRVTGGARPTASDLGGAHGIRIGGKKAAPSQAVTVNRGEVIDLGGAMLVLHPSNEAPLARWDDHLVELLAQSDLSVLLLGETGVGKTDAANALITASGGNAQLLDDAITLPADTKTRFIATTRRHDLVAPDGVITLFIPPLRDRPREIGALATRVLEEVCAQAGHRRAPRVSREAHGALVRHSWMDNLRELRATMAQAVTLSEGREIEPKHLVFESAPLPPQTMQTLSPSTTLPATPLNNAGGAPTTTISSSPPGRREP